MSSYIIKSQNFISDDQTKIFENRDYKVTTIHDPKNIVEKHIEIVEKLLINYHFEDIDYAILIAYVKLQKDGDCDVIFK